MSLTEKQIAFIRLANQNGYMNTISRKNAKELCRANNFKWPRWIAIDEQYRHSRGVYKLPNIKAAETTISTTPTKLETLNPQVATMNLQTIGTNISDSLIPNPNRNYVPFGNFSDVESIISSKMFYPVYVTGLSGNGKTMMIEQACAKARREMVRVNITAETDEDDLIGGFRLIDGQTVWHNGPVVMAMERGAVLLLDEVDLGTIKLMCLQPVLEGKSIFIKKINKLVQPARGFTVIATANTKGRGSDDGRFIGTNIMNEAFLERFSITMEQEYPPATTEKKILLNLLDHNDDDKTFVELLIKWADAIRRTYYDGGTTEIISTRRLVHICDAYKIFNRDRMKAIRLCLNRFDTDTKTSFIDLYTKIDAEINPTPSTVTITDVANTETSIATVNVSLEEKIKRAGEIAF
jgi:hypothetical protein